MEQWSRAWGAPAGSAMIRSCPEDFRVSEELGFELSGSGEHVFLYLQKRQLNSMDLLSRLARLSGVAERDIGLSGLKDRNAVTRQWFSVGMAGRPEPDWQLLATDGDVEVLATGRHLRKLRRGVHRANRFKLVLRQLSGDRQQLESRLQLLREQGVPNYFGEQRFGRNGSTLDQARRWISAGRKVSRNKRSLYFSALRAYLFNQLLAIRVDQHAWNSVVPGDVCLLHGSRSFFTCSEVEQDTQERVNSGDIHPGLPLWGQEKPTGGVARSREYADDLAQWQDVCAFLEQSGLDMAWRPARLLPDDFCWQFCDDGSLQLDFTLGAGGYATALLAEFVHYKKGMLKSGIGSE